MFDEQIFIKSLTVRPEDAKRFLDGFNPEWLGDARLQMILAELFEFTKKFGTPPNLDTLRKSLEDKDKVAYDNRLKPVLDEIESIDPDISMQIYVLDKARHVAIIRSFRSMVGSPGFQKLEDNYAGDEILEYVSKWTGNFIGLTEDKTYDLKKSFETLISEGGYLDEDSRIGCGIEPIDGWCAGGLRKKNLAILLAPTGAGKSATLTVIAHKIAATEGKRVWFISNELPINEVAERFLSRVTGQPLTKIMDNPSIAFKGLQRFWDQGLHKRLLLTEINKECSTDEIEADMEKYVSLYGWKPDVIVLDFMERMKPNLTGISRDKSWAYMGAVARDLVRFAKRKNILIWTAAQTNRGGQSAEVILLEHTQASTQHLQEAAAVISLQQVDGKKVDEEEQKKVHLKYRVLKLRHSKNEGQEAIVECDLGKMSISNVRVASSEVVYRGKKETTDKPEKERDVSNLNYEKKNKRKFKDSLT